MKKLEFPQPANSEQGSPAKTKAASPASRIRAEQKILCKLLALDCRKHKPSKSKKLCPSCEELRIELSAKLASCPFASHKPNCSACPESCWAPDEEELLRKLKQRAGRRLLLRHPTACLAHLCHEKPIAGYIAIAIGFLSLGLGLIGIVVPGMPTTVFVLLAAFLFAQASPRFYDWLLQQPLFGQIIRSREAERALPYGLKKRILLVFGLTVGLSIWLIPGLYAKLALACLALLGAFFLARLPEQQQVRPAEQAKPS